MDSRLIIVCFILSVICIIIDLILFSKVKKLNENTNTIDPKFIAQIMVIDKKVNFLNEGLEKINYKIDNLSQYKVKEVDEMTGYLKSGMSVSDIAKKKNISIKEVELMLKMKDLC